MVRADPGRRGPQPGAFTVSEPDSLDEQALQEQWPDDRPVTEALDELFRRYEDEIPWRDAA